MLLVKTILFVSTLAFPPSDRPHLSAAQGLVESGMNQYARGKSGDKGAYQVIEKYWGKVPNTLQAQTAQNERIMNTLIEESKGNIQKAIRKYNGRGPKTKVYLAKVRRKCFELIVVGV